MQHILTGNQPGLCGNRDPIMAPHNLYRCEGEDNWVSISCSSDEQWQAMASLLGINDPRYTAAASRKEFENDLDGQIAMWTASRDQWDVTHTLQDIGIPAMPSLDARSLEQDPHLNARGFIERLNHQEVGPLAHTGIPWLLRDGPNGVRTPAPMLGQHTDEVLTSLLGLTESEITHLRHRNILS